MTHEEWRKGGYKLMANEAVTTAKYFHYRHHGLDEKAKTLHDDDRRLFVHNLGVLLRQTDNDIVGLDWDAETDIVRIEFISGAIKNVNVAMDSYIAIIRDVCKTI